MVNFFKNLEYLDGNRYKICNTVLREQIIKFNQHLITCAPTILCMYVEKYFELMLPAAKKEIVLQLKD